MRPSMELLIVLMWVYCSAACYTSAGGNGGEPKPRMQQELDTSSCGASPFMECANVGNIQYPFWGSAACAASSPTFVLSNCNSSAIAVWDSFSSASQHGTGSSQPPYVIDIAAGSHSASIGLAWNLSSIRFDACDSLFSSNTLSDADSTPIIPPFIDLTSFANSSFAFAAPSTNPIYTTFLLFNCTNKASMPQLTFTPSLYELLEESTDCAAYKARCNRLLHISCINLRPRKELLLQHVVDTLACSHFTSGSTNISYPSGKITQWTTGLVQLTWSNGECTRCVDAGGVCVYDPLSPAKLLYCECGNQRIRDFNVPNMPTTCHVCHGGLVQCKPILKIYIGVAALVLAIMLLISIVYFRRWIGKGFVDFSVTLAPIAIRVLKKTLIHLQAFSYRPSYSFNMDMEGLTERPMEYSYASIASATKCFSSVIGEGGFGRVYKGMLPAQHASMQQGSSGMQIAVKVLEMRSRHSKNQFLNEVVTIGRIHHLNVVRLLGFCMQEDHEMLVYEYVSNVSLDKWLFDISGTTPTENQEKHVLDWGQRYAIALGIAKGLGYLHEECRHRTVHCDIKPQNILLDEEMCPKIADFGLARLMGREESQVVTIVKGTPGYMAPEFWMGGESSLSTKFDVYSYGMVLLEILSGRRNFMPCSRCFPALAFEAAMQGDFESIMDPRLRISSTDILDWTYVNMNGGGEGRDEEEEGEALQYSSQQQWAHQFQTAVFVALWCIQDQPANRPSMSEVVQYLDGVTIVSRNPPQPTISISPASLILSHTNSSSAHPHDFTPISVGR